MATSQLVSPEIRKAILQREIVHYVGQGYLVVSQTEHSAQLKKTKTFSCLWAVLWFLFFGIGIVFYLIYFAAKRDSLIYIEVDPFGRKIRNGDSIPIVWLIAGATFAMCVICILGAVIYSALGSMTFITPVLSMGAVLEFRSLQI